MSWQQPLSSPYLRLNGDSIPGWNRLSYSARQTFRSAVYNLLTIIALFVCLFPIFWMISTALRPTSQAQVVPVPLLPGDFIIENFRSLILETEFTTWYLNSLVITGGVVFLTTVTATLGGYGLTRLEIPYKRTFARSILFGYMFPSILISIPMYILWRQLGLINSQLGVILGNTALCLPFSLWLMWKFFQTVPYSLEESARIAGASRFRAFYEIALPMAKPGMIAVAVFSFAISWNQYTIPKVLLVDVEEWVLTIGLVSLQEGNVLFWGQIMAGAVLMLIPPFIFLYSLQKYLLHGFRAGGVG